MKHVVILRRVGLDELPLEYDHRVKKFCWSERFTVFPEHRYAAHALEREKAAGHAWGESRIVSLKEVVNA